MTGDLHVATWPEERILAYAWTMAREASVDRIALLQQLATVIVLRPDDWSPAVVRQEHVSGVHRRGLSIPDRCFCCRTGDRLLYWHHIVAVANGGSNDFRNLVAICNRCHKAVHPWLEDRPGDFRRGAGGWQSIGEVMRAQLEKNPKADTVPEFLGVDEERQAKFAFKASKGK